MLAVEKLGLGRVERSIALGVKSQRLDEFALGVNGVLGQKRPTARARASAQVGAPGSAKLSKAVYVPTRGLFIETGSDAGPTMSGVNMSAMCGWQTPGRRPQLLQLSRGDFGVGRRKINEGQPPPRDRVPDGHPRALASFVT